MKPNLEKRFLDGVAAVAPWLTPLIPTYFAAYNAWYYLIKGQNIWDIAAVVIIALVLETIGLAGVHTLIQFWAWNRNRAKDSQGAPIWLAVISVVMYIVIVITINGLLDFFHLYKPDIVPYISIIVVALLSLLSLNSALIVALRAGQDDRVRQDAEMKIKNDLDQQKVKVEQTEKERQRLELEKELREERRAERAAVRELKFREKELELTTQATHAGNLPETYRKDNSYRNDNADWRKVSHEQRLEIIGWIESFHHAEAVKKIAKEYKLDARTARNWVTKANEYSASYKVPITTGD